MRWLLSFILVGLCCAVFALTDEEFQQAQKDLNQAIKDKRWTVAKDLIAKIASDDSGRAVRALASALKKVATEFELVAEIRNGFCGMTSSDAKKAMFSLLKSGDEKVKILMIDAISGLSGEDVTKALIGCLADRREVVAVSAARALGKRSDRESIDPLIDALEKAEKRKRHRVIYEIIIALEKITGKSGLQAAIDWKNWWRTHKDKPFKKGEEVPITPSPFKGKLQTTSFFGIEIRSKRVIFIIDTSGSMKVADPPPENWRKKAEEEFDRRTRVVDKKELERLKKEHEKKMKELEKEMGNWGKERVRMYRTKKELIKTIKTLQSDVKFNIIAFSTGVTPWKKKLVKANEGNRNAAIKWVEKLEADGLTFTDEAIMEAFKDKEVDMIVLLTDGAPTHIGGPGKAEWGGHQDSLALIEEILQWVRKNNLTRKITIHTLGFMGANFEFLKQLAAENNGKFKEIE